MVMYTLCIAGQYELKMSQFENPPPEGQIRPVHPEYVADLKKSRLERTSLMNTSQTQLLL